MSALLSLTVAWQPHPMVSEPSPQRRGRGRPRQTNGDDAGLVSRDLVVDLAYEEARTKPLGEVSFVQIAQQLGVVPGSLHYHIGTKDDLSTAILNRFYRNLVISLKDMPYGLDWRDRIRFFARTLMEAQRAHRGAAEHIQTKSRYRLFQKVAVGETDYGAAYLDFAFMLFREAGFHASQAALCYHVLALHCLASANSTNARLSPAEHEAFLLKRAAAIEPDTMPGLDFGLPAFARVQAEDAFEFGLEALLDRFASIRLNG